jgi:hypothetical protein
MGSQSGMQRSLRMAANFVMKLHVAALDVAARYPAISLYPVIDGLYACAAAKGPVLGFVKDVFFKLALTFVLENQRRFKFCIRAGLAFGPIVVGSDVTNCSNILRANVDYCRRIFLGMPLSQAYNAAGDAAPFGIALHESARAFAPPNAEPLIEAHLKWWELIDNPELSKELVDSLKEALKDYHQWCNRHSETLQYKRESISVHEMLVKDYFEE